MELIGKHVLHCKLSKIFLIVVFNNYLCAEQDTRPVEFTEMTQGNNCVHLEDEINRLLREQVVNFERAVKCHVICTLTRRVFDGGSIYNELDGRQTMSSLFKVIFLLDLLKINADSYRHDSHMINKLPSTQALFGINLREHEDCVTSSNSFT